jgi:hypothetical protein
MQWYLTSRTFKDTFAPDPLEPEVMVYWVVNGQAVATANISVDATTTGPMRNGIARVSSTGNLENMLYVNSYRVNSSYFDFSCTPRPPESYTQPYCAYSAEIPVVLGTTSTITATAYSRGTANEADGLNEWAWAGVSGSLTVSFFEEDGNTPVPLQGPGSDTTIPEPSTYLLSFAGILTVALQRYRRVQS